MELTIEEKEKIFERLKKDIIDFSKRHFRLERKKEQQKEALEFLKEIEEKGLYADGYKILQVYYSALDRKR